MNVNGISGNNAGVRYFPMNRNPGTDSVSRKLQNQIANARERMQEIGENKEMAPAGKGTSMDDMLGGRRQTSKSAKDSTGMSGAELQAMIAADFSMKQVAVQGTVKTRMEGKAGILEAEIQSDGARGGDVSKKKEELEEIEAKTQDMTASQMNSLSDINQKLEEAAKEDQKEREAEDKAEKNDGRDQAERSVTEPVGSHVDVKR